MTPGTHQAWRPLTLPAGCIFALGWTALATSTPQLVYNTFDSVPAGRYRTSPANALAPGDLMLVHLPQWLRSTATCWRLHRC
jgi:type IV secretory pathway protease TraF